jgi:hypothetical protein
MDGTFQACHSVKILHKTSICLTDILERCFNSTMPSSDGILSSELAFGENIAHCAISSWLDPACKRDHSIIHKYKKLKEVGTKFNNIHIS